ncbi:MAG TPA: DNA glycosylase [Thermoplasmata archaeon]
MATRDEQNRDVSLRKFSLDIRPLDLDLTLGCGQTFRWRKLPDGSWRGPVSDQLVTLKPNGKTVQALVKPGRRDADDLVSNYLRADDDIDRIQRVLGRDKILARGMRDVRGLRIVKMDEWECLVSYLLATFANIPRISGMVETLAGKYGKDIADGIKTFPRRAQLGKASERDLVRCGLGYRAGYLAELRDTVDDRRLEDLTRMDYRELRGELLELPGVGEKVADCVSLFGFGKLEAFPIDVWMERALSRLYGQKGSYRRLREFAGERFGQYAGYAQEYLYYNERLRFPRGECCFSDKTRR